MVSLLTVLSASNVIRVQGSNYKVYLTSPVLRQLNRAYFKVVNPEVVVSGV